MLRLPWLPAGLEDSLPELGVRLDWAADRALDFCRDGGVKDFLIDLSGNIRASGRPQWGEDWQIGIRDPFDRSRIIGQIILQRRSNFTAFVLNSQG